MGGEAKRNLGWGPKDQQTVNEHSKTSCIMSLIASLESPFSHLYNKGVWYGHY